MCVINMKQIYKCGIAILAVLIMVIAAGFTNVSASKISKGKKDSSISVSQESEIVLTSEDIYELENYLELVDSDDREALEAVIVFLEENDEMTMEELDSILSSYSGLTRFYANGAVEDIPDRCVIDRRGHFLISPNIKYLNKQGTNLWVKTSSGDRDYPDLPATVSMNLFLGTYCFNKITPYIGFLMDGWGFGFNIHSYKVSRMPKILEHRLDRIFEMFPKLTMILSSIQ